MSENEPTLKSALFSTNCSSIILCSLIFPPNSCFNNSIFLLSDREKWWSSRQSNYSWGYAHTYWLLSCLSLLLFSKRKDRGEVQNCKHPFSLNLNLSSAFQSSLVICIELLCRKEWCSIQEGVRLVFSRRPSS